jgi:hypothetical protein
LFLLLVSCAAFFAVIPVEAGIQLSFNLPRSWMPSSAVENPAFAGMTSKEQSWIPAFAGMTAKEQSWIPA